MAEPDSPSVANTNAEHSESHVNVNASAGMCCSGLMRYFSWAAAAASSHMVHETFMLVRSKTEKHNLNEVGTVQFETDSRGSWAGRARASFTGGSNRAATAKSRAHCGGGTGRRSVPRGDVTGESSTTTVPYVARCASMTKRCTREMWQP